MFPISGHPVLNELISPHQSKFQRKCGKITNVKKTDEYVKVNCKGHVGTSVKIEIPGNKIYLNFESSC